MEISVTRALAQLKLLDKKIKDKTDKLLVASIAKNEHTQDLREKFVSDQTALLQQVQDFIRNRNKIKSAVVESNAKTKVSINGHDMTVASAIERKTSIEYDRALNKRLREQYYSNAVRVEKHNDAVLAEADNRAETMLSAETARLKGEEYENFIESYTKVRNADLIAIDGVKEFIDQMQDEIDDFESEIDLILDESNTKTLISI